jgi:cobalt-zinc-cadmium efflux system protein
MGALHDHTDTGARITRMTTAALILTGFFAIELTTAQAIGSIALLADTGHILTDVVTAIMGLAAVLLARRGSSAPDRTYGWHRAEVFTAVANAVLLVGVSVFVAYQAFRRLSETPDVPGVPMIVVALVGLAANAVVALLLRSHAAQSLAVRGAWRSSPTPSARLGCSSPGWSR